jgi:lysozyme
MDWLDYCLPLVKRWEGCRLSAYKCPAGVWTIGYGCTGPGIGPGVVWTSRQAETALCARLRAFHDDVMAMVRVPLSAPQIAALVSLAYNIGSQALKGSTLLKKLNAGDYAASAAQFDRWNKAAGEVLAGLTHRRADERALFERGR